MKALSIRQLVKTYPNGVTALSGIDFDIHQGDFFALLGPNGAGKSTTIGIITSLIKKTSGMVSIFDHDIDKEPAAAKRKIGVVPQEFNFNIFETPMQILIQQAGYYGVPVAIAKERAEHYLKRLELWDKKDSIGLLLSGGMKRRLMIARALVHEPELLILDEPTAGVDIEIRRSMWHFIREINQKGTTVILTTHYLEEAENLCKNIAIINKGKIIENTSTKLLLQQLNIETMILYSNQTLLSCPVIEDYGVRLIDENTLEVDIIKSQSINPVFNQLNQQGIDIVSMRNKANRLEELFLSLVNQGENDESTN